MPPADPLARFLRAVHRRQVILRVVEGAGIGLLVAGAVAVAIGALLLGREAPGLALPGGLVAAGALLGALIGWMRRPTVLASAVTADRQLGLAELLSTAWTLSPAGDPWTRTVRRLAERAAGERRPSQLVLHRLGGRAWGAVGATLLLAFAVGLLNQTLPAGRADPDLPAPTFSPRLAQSPPARASGAPGAVAASGSSPERTFATPGATAPADASSPQDPRAADSASAAGASGVGGTHATDDAHRAPAPQPSDGAPGRQPGDGTIAAGAGAPDATGSAAGASGAIIGNADAPAPPPWASDTWPEARAGARRQLDAGTIPPDYRPLVRDYFSP